MMLICRVVLCLRCDVCVAWCVLCLLCIGVVMCWCVCVCWCGGSPLLLLLRCAECAIRFKGAVGFGVVLMFGFACVLIWHHMLVFVVFVRLIWCGC